MDYAAAAILVLPRIISKLIKGTLDIFWNLAFGFLALSLATANEAPLPPVDETMAKEVPQSQQQRLLYMLAIFVGFLGFFSWYAQGFLEIL